MENSAAPQYRAARRSPREIDQLIQDYRTSRLSQRAYAEGQDIAYSTFTSWLRKRRRNGDEPPAQEWLELPIPGPVAQTDFCLEWPPGPRLRFGPGFNPSEMAHLIDLLNPSCSH